MMTSDTMAHDALSAMLETFFAERLARAEELGPAYAALWQRMAVAVRGGKRLRPRLVLTAHAELGGVDEAAAHTAAAAFELLHTALLFHDDLLDGDLVRRGHPNLAGTFAAEAMDVRWVDADDLATALDAAPWAFSPWLVLQARELSPGGAIHGAAWRRAVT